MYLQFLATCHKKEIVPGRICKTTLLETNLFMNTKINIKL